MLCGWEGNRRCGVALAMHHKLSGIPTYRLNGLEKGDEYPAYDITPGSEPPSHRLSGIAIYSLSGLEKGDEHSADDITPWFRTAPPIRGVLNQGLCRRRGTHLPFLDH